MFDNHRPIGIYNLIGWQISENELFKKYKKHGFTHIGLYWNSENINEKQNMINNAKNAGLIVEIVHGPLRDNSEIWKTGEVAENYFEYIKESIILCGKNGIKKFVMHSAGKEAFKFSEIGLNRFRCLVKLAEENDVILNIENLRTVDHLIYLFEKIDSPNFKFCLDTGHANIWCYSPMEWIEKYKNKINTVHINDNDGIEFHDYHYIPFDGCIEWDKLMPALNEYYKGPIMLELNNFKDATKSYSDLDVYLETAYHAAEKLKNI